MGRAERALAEALGDVTKHCPKCNGAGWLWDYELDEPTGRDPSYGPDDTRYSCDGDLHEIVRTLRTAIATAEAERDAALFDIAFNSNDLSGDPMQWESVKTYLELGGRVVDGELLDAGALRAAVKLAKRARTEALMTAEMIASDFAGEIWDAMHPQAHEAVEVVEARIAAVRTGDTAEGGSHDQ